MYEVSLSPNVNGNVNGKVDVAEIVLTNAIVISTTNIPTFIDFINRLCCCILLNVCPYVHHTSAFQKTYLSAVTAEGAFIVNCVSVTFVTQQLATSLCVPVSLMPCSGALAKP